MICGYPVNDKYEVTFCGLTWIEDSFLKAKERIEILIPAND